VLVGAAGGFGRSAASSALDETTKIRDPEMKALMSVVGFLRRVITRPPGELGVVFAFCGDKSSD
jgi:hypothetical protein